MYIFSSSSNSRRPSGCLAPFTIVHLTYSARYTAMTSQPAPLPPPLVMSSFHIQSVLVLSLLNSVVTSGYFNQSLFAVPPLPGQVTGVMTYKLAGRSARRLPGFTSCATMELIWSLRVCAVLAAVTLANGGKDLSFPSH